GDEERPAIRRRPDVLGHGGAVESPRVERHVARHGPGRKVELQELPRELAGGKGEPPVGRELHVVHSPALDRDRLNELHCLHVPEIEAPAPFRDHEGEATVGREVQVVGVRDRDARALLPGRGPSFAAASGGERRKAHDDARRRELHPGRHAMRIFPTLRFSRMRWNASAARSAGNTASTITRIAPSPNAGSSSSLNRFTIVAFSARLRARSVEPTIRARLRISRPRSRSASGPDMVAMITIRPPVLSTLRSPARLARPTGSSTTSTASRPHRASISAAKSRRDVSSTRSAPADAMAGTLSALRVAAATRAPLS